MSPSRVLPATALAFFLLPACITRNTTSLGSDTSGAEDVGGTESDIESLGTSLIASNGQSVAMAPADMAGGIRTQDVTTASSAGTWFQPAGCVTATVDTTTQSATYVFNECTGPFGLVEVDGTVTVTWTVANGELTLRYSAIGFKVNRATLNSWQATGVVTANGTSREMVWTASLTGTTGRGRTFTRTNDKDIRWTVGEPCIAVSGESDGTILGAHLRTTIVSFQRCAAGCPQADSEIKVEDLDDGRSIDIKYSGGPEAVLTVNGKSTVIGLACE